MLRCADFNSRVACYYGALAFSCLFLLLAAARASTEFDVPPGAEAKPTSIVAGPDGNLWVFESGRQSIARMTPTGQLTEFSIPAGVTVGRMIAGPDGAIWFTDSVYSQIGRMSLTGALTLYPLTPGWYAVDITSSVDGNLWFTEISQFAGRLARMTTSGVVTEFGNASYAGLITSDLDGNLWIAYGGLYKVSPSGVTLGTFNPCPSSQFGGQYVTWVPTTTFGLPGPAATSLLVVW